MGREIQILWAGRHERGVWDDLCERYRSRIRRHLPIEDRVVRTKLVKDPRARQQVESQALVKALPEPARVVALDRRGRQMSSQEFSNWLAAVRTDWSHPLVFVLGSDLGLGELLLERAQERISLGRMTLPHELARVVLYEQIYRALSIATGMKYHRDPL